MSVKVIYYDYSIFRTKPDRLLAASIEISPAYWSRIEREMEKPPKDELILAAAETLGLSSDDAFVAAGRLPPDIQADIRIVVHQYRNLIK